MLSIFQDNGEWRLYWGWKTWRHYCCCQKLLETALWMKYFLCLFYLKELPTGINLDRCQPSSRMGSSQNIGIPPRYRPFRLIKEEDSSDADTGNIRLYLTLFFLSLILLFIFILIQSLGCVGWVRRNGSSSLLTVVRIVESYSFTPAEEQRIR
jgi:hypothetical protein